MKKETPPMRLANLQLQNFKCFKKAQNIDFKKLTILTGANSSGKSSLIYSILGAMQTPSFPFQYSPNGKYVNMGDFRDLASDHKINHEITIGYRFLTEKTGAEYNIKTVWVANKKTRLPLLKEIEFIGDDSVITIKKTLNNYILDFSYNPPEKSNPTDIERQAIIKDLNISFMSYSARSSKLSKRQYDLEKEKADYENRFKESLTSHKVIGYKFKSIEKLVRERDKKLPIRFEQAFSWLQFALDGFDDQCNFISSTRLHPSRTYLEKSKNYKKVGKFGEEYLDQIIMWEDMKSPKLTELLKIMKDLTLIYSIKSRRMDGGRYEVLLRTKRNGTISQISDIGFGISQFLPIIVADLQLQDYSTLFISQPEIHLHPSAQSLFGDFIGKQIKKKHKNYVIETHSEYLINRIRLAIVKGEIKESDVAIYYIENKEADAKIHKLHLGKKGEIENAPDDFFKTYMMDVMNIALNSVG